MMKIFISQGMVGRSDEEVLQERAKAAQILQDYFHSEIGDDITIEIIDSYIEEDPPDVCNTGVWYMGHSIIMMSEADRVAFLPNWEQYGGCRLEKQIADYYNVPSVIFHSDWSIES